MRFIIAAIIFLSACSASAQTMFIQRFKITTADSVSLNVSEVRIAYELSNGYIQLMYSYPYQAIDTKTDFDDAVAASCGNLVAVSARVNGQVRRIAINPQWINKIYRSLAGKVQLVMRETGQVVDVVGTYESITAFFDDCLSGAGSLTTVSHDGTLSGSGTPGDPLKADTLVLATQYDLTLIPRVDTVYNYDSLRAYSGIAPMVLVKKDRINGLFKRVTGSWADDGGVTIVGTYKWRRVADDLHTANVQWFEAVGDSITDDNAAVQRALTYCLDTSITTLYFPAGRYRTSEVIDIYKKRNFAIKGDGMHASFIVPVNCSGIKMRTDSVALILDSKYGSAEGNDFQVRDISIISDGSTPEIERTGIKILGGYNVKLWNVRVEEFFNASGRGVGIRIGTAIPGSTDADQHTIFDNVYVGECDTGIVTDLRNSMVWRDVKVDQSNKIGVVTSNSLFWTNGLLQGSTECGLWIRKKTFAIAGIELSNIHVEANSTGGGKYGAIYKPDAVDATHISIHNCYLSSPGNSRLFNLNHILYGSVINNKYQGNSTTDTIYLQNINATVWGGDDYTRLKLITTGCLISWVMGSDTSVSTITGHTFSSDDPGVNVISVGGRASIGSGYVTSTAPDNGLIVQGKVGIGQATAAQQLDVLGIQRLSGSATTITKLMGRNASNDIGKVEFGTNVMIHGDTLYASGIDSTWAKTSGTNRYTGKRITSPVYRSSSARINMTGDSAALTLKYASTQTTPIFLLQRNDGTSSAWLHVYNETTANPSLVMGKVGATFISTSPNNAVFGITGAQFPAFAGDNTLIGNRAGNALNGGYENSVLGSRAMQSATTAYQNVAGGYSALQNITTGFQNMAIGRRAMLSLTTGDGNVGIGSDALRLITTTKDNSAVGRQACDRCIGARNTVFGSAAGRLASGSGIVCLGYSAGELLDTSSNVLYIANTNTTTPLIGGHFTLKRVGINSTIAALSQTFNVEGTAKITGSVTGVDRLMARNSSGDIGRLYTGPGISISGDTLYAAGTTSGGNGIYGGDGNIPYGGSQVLMDTIGETVRFIMNTGNTTTREMIRMTTVENAFTRFFVLQGPTDSMRVFRASAGRQYTLQAYGGTSLSLASDSTLIYTADSIKTTEGAIKTETGMAFLQGLTSTGIHKRMEGTANGQTALWNDTGGYWYVGQPTSGTLYTVTSTTTVAATTTLTSIIGSGSGSMTIPAGYMTAGKQFKVKVSGIYSTPLVAKGDITVYVKAGSTVLAVGTITGLGTNVTDQEYEIDVTFTCRSTGVSGTVMVTGNCEYDTVDDMMPNRKSLNNGTSTVTLDTTSAQAIDVQVQWSNNTSGNSWSSLNASMEAKN